jgi:hypothetical protein
VICQKCKTFYPPLYSFRGLGFSYFERLLLSADGTEFSEFRAAAARSKDELVSMGYNASSVEDFFDNFMEVVDRLKKKDADAEAAGGDGEQVGFGGIFNRLHFNLLTVLAGSSNCLTDTQLPFRAP